LERAAREMEMEMEMEVEVEMLRHGAAAAISSV
jgi:hypothetical protein